MPIYEYACEQCGNRFEVKQSIKDAPLVSCSACGGTVKKLISSPAIMFKGTGWYITDYSDKLKPPAGDGASAAAESKTADSKKDGATPAPASAPASSTSTPTPPAASTSSTTPASSGSSAPSSSTAAGK